MACSAEKDRRLDELGHKVEQLTVDHASLAESIHAQTEALTLIATNTSAIKEIVGHYQSFKGFFIVSNSVGKILIALAAAVGAIVLLGDVNVTVGK